MSEAPFVTYTRMVKETRDVAVVTVENIGQIAALISGQVDYSKDPPVLTVPGLSTPWYVKIGETLVLTRGFEGRRHSVMRSSIDDS